MIETNNKDKDNDKDKDKNRDKYKDKDKDKDQPLVCRLAHGVKKFADSHPSRVALLF
jgi:hypothetical protein